MGKVIEAGWAVVEGEKVVKRYSRRGDAENYIRGETLRSNRKLVLVQLFYSDGLIEPLENTN